MKLMSTVLVSTLACASISTVLPMNQAQAKEAYKLNDKGILVDASTKKVVKGFVVYKNKLYQNGKLYTKKAYQIVKVNGALKLFYGSTLKKGKLTKTYQGKTYLFSDGVLPKDVVSYKGRYFVDGVRVQTVKAAIAKIDEIDANKGEAKDFLAALKELNVALYAEAREAKTDKDLAYYVKGLDKVIEVKNLIHMKTLKYEKEMTKDFDWYVKTAKVLAKTPPGKKLKTTKEKMPALLNQHQFNEFSFFAVIIEANSKLISGYQSDQIMDAIIGIADLRHGDSKIVTFDEIEASITKYIEATRTLDLIKKNIVFEEDTRLTAEENLRVLAEAVTNSKIKVPAGIFIGVDVGLATQVIDQTLTQSKDSYIYEITIKKNGIIIKGLGMGSVQSKIENPETIVVKKYENLLNGEN